jgi:thiol-disulfide isomerase/thioredoxin
VLPSKACAQQDISRLESYKKLCLAVEKSPDDETLHKSFLNLFRAKDTALLVKQYNKWIEQFPSNTTIPFFIGKELYRIQSPLAKPYLLKTVSLNNSIAEVWNMLYIDAMRWGDNTQKVYFAKNAARADSKSSEYAFNYAYSLKPFDREQSDSLLLDISLRFKESENGAKALYWLSVNETDEKIKLAYLDQLHKRFAMTHTDAFKSGMRGYFSLLINQEKYNEAFKLALDMVYVIETNKLEWKHKVKEVKKFLRYQEAFTSGEYELAGEILNSIKLYDHFSVSYIAATEALVFLKANIADLRNQTKLAYDTLLINYTTKPSDKLKLYLLKYGAKINKDSNEIFLEIQNMRLKNAKPATYFSLKNYLNNENVSLDHFKGKVLLLTFWYPGCGPCRAEFPYFERAIKKFNPDEVAYVGINGVLSQDDYVIPFMKGTNYSFLPLRDDKSWDKGNLKEGYPINYLIDQQGRIIFSDFRISQSNERMLEIMIEDLINSK